MTDIEAGPPGDPPGRYRTPARIGSLDRVEVYVDEFGDRGFTTRSSPFFAMTAVMVPVESVPYMKVIAAGLRAQIRTDKPLHWVEHFTPKPKHAARRALAASLVAGIPGVTTIYVIADKATMIAGEHLRHDQDAFYNYVTKLLLERVAFAAKHWPRGPRLALARLSSIKGTRDVDSVEYLEAVRDRGRTDAPMEFIKWPPTWHGPERYDGLQIADIYMGMMGAALTGDDGDLGCATHLLTHRHQIRRGPAGQVIGWGIKVYGDPLVLTRRAWWPALSS
ncbi:MAG: DUF3800 domain-containing protein [Actinobacteria bacterium]|nr:DUF3800 domain-containing protein [Actinomycetota bacterium]MCG2802707.1 DUF3800 domain-containing protein [Cellulomonas sp.]